MDWCNTLAKNNKVFKGGITPFAVMNNIFVDYQSVRCGVIPLKVLHLLGGIWCNTGVILSGVLHQGKQIDIQLFSMHKTTKM